MTCGEEGSGNDTWQLGSGRVTRYPGTQLIWAMHFQLCLLRPGSYFWVRVLGCVFSGDWAFLVLSWSLFSHSGFFVGMSFSFCSLSKMLINIFKFVLSNKVQMFKIEFECQDHN